MSLGENLISARDGKGSSAKPKGGSAIDAIDRRAAWAERRSQWDMNIRWTIFDDRRILSLDDLHSRMRDYHVVNTPPISLPCFGNGEIFEREFEVAFQYHLVPGPAATRAPPSSSGEKPVKNVPIGHLTKVLMEILNNSILETPGKVNLLWIHVLNPSSLLTVLTHFRVSHMFQVYFGDERPHSSFVASTDELILSLMSCVLQVNNLVQLNKLFIYIRNNLCITFEMDPVPSLELLSTGESLTASVASGVLERVGQISLTNTTQLLCALATQNLSTQTRLLDFCTISVYYFRNKLNQAQFEMVRGDADRKVRVVEASLLIMQSFAKGAATAIESASLDYAYTAQGIYCVCRGFC